MYTSQRHHSAFWPQDCHGNVVTPIFPENPSVPPKHEMKRSYFGDVFRFQILRVQLLIQRMVTKSLIKLNPLRVFVVYDVPPLD